MSNPKLTRATESQPLDPIQKDSPEAAVDSEHHAEPSLEDIFGPVIHSYTRSQAIDDGVLVDVTATAQEAGFKVPTALTQPSLFTDVTRTPHSIVSKC